MRINRFSEARGIFESEEFSLEPRIYCFGDDGGGGAGGSAGDFEGTNFGGDTATAGGDLGGGGSDSNDNDGDGIPNSIDATPGTPSGAGDAFDAVGAAYDEAVASIAAGEDAFGPGGAAGYGGGGDDDDDDSAPDIGDTSPPPAPAPSDADNDGIPDTIDIDAGTGTGTPVEGVDIFDPGFDDTDLADTIEIAPPTIEVTPPSVASDVDLSMLQAINQERMASGGTRQVDRTYNANDPTGLMGQGTGVESLTGDALRDALLGPAPETKTLGESLIDDLFEELNPGPESFTPESLTPDTNVPPTGTISITDPTGRAVSTTTLGEIPTGTNQFQEQPEDQAIYGGRGIASPQVATLTDAERRSQQGIDAEMTGIPIEATAERKEIAGQDPRAPDYTLAEAQANLEAARAEAYRDKQFGFDTGLPSSINVFGANVPTGIGVVEGIADALFDPESSLANAIAERGIKSVDGESAEGTANYNPNGLEVVTTGTPVTEGGRAAAYDPNNNVVYDTDPFSGVNPFGEERVPENIQNLYSKKNAIDDAERARQGDGGDARQAQTTEPDITCPEGFEYDPVSDSCVVKEPAPRVYGGPASVNIATPTLTQYTQMAAPRPTALQPSQLIAPRPIDPLTGRPFRDGGIVSVAKFAEGGRVTSSDIAYLQGLVQAGDRNVGDFVSAIENYIGTSTSELPESIQTALKVREQLRPIQADVFEKYGFDRSQYDKYMNRGLKGLGEDRNFATNSYFVYNPTDNQQMVSNTDGMTIENADAMRSLLRVMDQYNSSTGGAYGSDKQNIRLNFTSGDKFDLLVDGRKLGNFSGSSEGMQNAADSMVSYLSGAYAAPELSQVYQAKQQMQSLPTYEGQSAYKDLAQQTLNTIVGKTDAQDWMDINKDDQVNISDAVQLLKYGSGLEEVPDDIFMLTPQGQIASLQDKYGQLESTYNTLTSDYGTVTGSMRDLEEQLAKQTQETEALQGQLSGFEGYIDPDTYAQATGQISDLQTQLSGLEGYVDPTTYGNLQSQLDQRIADYNALNTTYGTTQEDLNRAASQIQELQSTIGDLSGQKQRAQTQALIQQYGQAPDYSQYTQPAQSFMPQAAQTTPYTQYAPPAGIAGLQPTLGPTLAPPQFADQPALDIPLLQLPQLDPLMPVPYAPPNLYNPFASPTQNFGR